VAVAAVVKVICAEAIATAAPQQRRALPAELREKRQKVCDDQGTEAQRLLHEG
jgi:signal transduction histidine kinase